MLLGVALGLGAGADAQPGNLDCAISLDSSDRVYSHAMEVDDDGNVLLGGVFRGTVDFDPGPGVVEIVGDTDLVGTEGEYRQGYIAKYDDSGALRFVRTVTGFGNVYVEGIATAHNDDLLVYGQFETFPVGAGEELDFDPGIAVYHVSSLNTFSMFLLRLNPSGNFVSMQTWTTGVSQGIGTINDLVLDPQGNIYLHGIYETGGTFDADPGPGVTMLPVPLEDDGFLIKLDSEGQFVYAYTVNGTYDQRVEVVRIHPNGNAYVLGAFSGTVDFDPGAGVANLVGAPDNSQDSIYLVQLDGAGNFLSANFLAESQASSNCHALGADFDVFGNFYVCGAVLGDADFDSSAGTVILSGNPIDRLAFVVKLDSGLALQYGHVFEPTGYCRFWDLEATPEGSVYLSGEFEDTVDFDPGTNEANLTSPGTPSSRDGVLLRLNADGSYNYAFNLESDTSGSVDLVDLDRRQRLRFVATYSGSADADPNSVNGYPLTAGGTQDCVLVKLDPEPVPPVPNVPQVLRTAPVSYFNLVYPVFEVEFSEEVTGVDPTDFVVSGSTGASVVGVLPKPGTPNTYQLAIALTPTEGEYVRLSLVDDDTILSTATSQPLGGTGAGNGSFDDGRGILIKSQGVDVDAGNLEYAFALAAQGIQTCHRTS